MDVETIKATMIEQLKEMCEELTKTPHIKEPTLTYIGPIWDTDAIVKRRYALGQCDGALKVLKPILTEDEYTKLEHMVDDAVMKG